MNTFKIPCSWEMYGTLRVEAKTLKEAIEKAKMEEDIFNLPEGNYIDGSFKLDLNDENLLKVLNK